MSGWISHRVLVGLLRNDNVARRVCTIPSSSPTVMHWRFWEWRMPPVRLSSETRTFDGPESRHSVQSERGFEDGDRVSICPKQKPQRLIRVGIGFKASQCGRLTLLCRLMSGLILLFVRISLSPNV